jgi:hypothetical protein
MMPNEYEKESVIHSEEHDTNMPSFEGSAGTKNVNELAPEGQVTGNSSEKDKDDEASTSVAGYKGIKRLRKICGELVNNAKVQSLLVLLITINAVMMGLATFNFVSQNPSVNAAFESADTVFLIIFTVELILQFIYHGVRLFLDGWLLFDFTIIILSWSLASLQIIRAFRVFRALRLVNRITVMRNLVLALGTVMPRMGAITLLLCLIFYIYAVMFTQLFGDLYEEGALDETYFVRIDNSFFTLFQIMTLDAWDPLSRQLKEEISWSWFPVLTFVVITAFIVVNLIIAVICDAVAALEAKEKAMLMGDTLIAEGLAEGNAQHVRFLNQHHVREELIILEDRLQKLCSMQERTLQALELLTNHVTAEVRT